MTADRPAAVLWDLDGTLIDSEPYWMAEETLLVERFGGSWTHEEALALVGQGLDFSAAVLQGAGVPWTAQKIIDHLTDSVMTRVRAELPWRPGARELLAEVREAGVPTALVTMSIRRMAELVADAISSLDGHAAFDVIVSGSDVSNSKPHPEAYLSAAAQLGVEPADCIAIEDSPIGLSAAVASGARSIGVPLVLPLPESAPESDASARWTIWDTLQGRTIADLTAVLDAARARDSTGSASSESASSGASTIEAMP